MREYCCITNTSFNGLHDLGEPETGSAVHQDVNLMLGDPAYSTCSARGQASSTHNVFCKDNIENAVRFISNFMTSVAQGPIFRSGLVYPH